MANANYGFYLYNGNAAGPLPQLPMPDLGSTPAGYQKVDFSTWLQTLQNLKNAPQSSQGVNLQQFYQNFINQLSNSDFPNLTNIVQGALNGTVTPEQANQMASNVPSPYSQDSNGNWVYNLQAQQQQQAQLDAQVAAGTMQKVPVGNGFGYVPVNSAATQNIANPTNALAAQQGNPTISASSSSITPASLFTNSSNSGLNVPQFSLAADGRTVLDANGNYVSLDQYKQLTNQTGVPDNQVNWSFVQPNNSQNGSGSSGQTSSGSGATSTDGSTGSTATSSGTTGVTDPNNPASQLTGQWADLYNQLNTYLQKLQANGQTVNPNIQITPDQIAKFTAQAQNEISPYYSSQLAIARQSLMQNLGYSASQIQAQEADLERQYGNQLRTIASNSADQGFAQSGIRAQQESNLASDTQSSIDQARASLSNSANNAAASFAQQWGGSSLPSVSVSSAPRVLPSQPKFSTTGASSSVYNLSPDVYASLTGAQQYQQTADVNNRVSQLEGAYNQTQANNQARTLTL